MPESIALGTGVLIWECALKPIIDSIKKEYGDEAKKLLKSSMKKVYEKLPFQKSELEVIEAEIVEADKAVLTDKEKFLEFIQSNTQIQKLISEVAQREPNISIAIEKSSNEILIHGNSNSISF